MFVRTMGRYSLREKAIVAGAVLLPAVLSLMAMAWEERDRRDRAELEAARQVRYYEYTVRQVDTALDHPVGLRGRRLIEDDGRGNGVVLKSGGGDILTGLSSEEILEQLDLDYQDVYDYYGGADELW